MTLRKPYLKSFISAFVCSALSLAPIAAGAEPQSSQGASPRSHAIEAPEVVQQRQTIAIAELSDNVAKPSTLALSPAAREIADLAGITPILQELAVVQASMPQSNEDVSALAVTQRQKLIYLRNKLNFLIEDLNLQVNSTRSKIEAAIAQADDLRAYITEQRTRIQRRNSQINLISGGVTKMVGYGIAMAPISLLTTNVLEVFDGGVQSSLSALALRQQRQEGKLEHGMPPVLTSFLFDTNASINYPKSIWSFLSSPSSPGVHISRRQALIARWNKQGILIHETQKGKELETSELLDQRMAMLDDVKSVVSEMDNGLMELSDSIMASYAKDGAW
jgi:hypothetical protein